MADNIVTQIKNIFKKADTAPTTNDTIQNQKPSTLVTTPPSVFNRYTIQGLNTSRYDRLTYCNSMYEEDGRVQESTNTLSRDIVKDGFEIFIKDGPKKAQRIADDLIKRLNLNLLLYDFVRRTFLDGESFLEIGINSNREIIAVKRHETLNMRVNAGEDFVIHDPSKAYWYSVNSTDINPSNESVFFADWQMLHPKWIPDRKGVYGLPLFYSSRGFYQRAHDGEDDIYVRRRSRAGIKYLHVIEDGTPSDIDTYKEKNKEALENPLAAQADFFTAKKGSIQVVEGDNNIGEMSDIMHNIESLLIASPVPSGLIGYGKDYNRDTLTMQNEQYKVTIDFLTDMWVGAQFIKPILERAWLLQGIVPENLDYDLLWRYRVVLSPAELTDVAEAALKFKASGWGKELIAKMFYRYVPKTTIREMLDGMDDVVVDANDLNKSGTSDGTNSTVPTQQTVKNTKQRTPRVTSTNSSGANLERK